MLRPMDAPVSATVTPLADSRVRVDVQVAPAELGRALDSAARQIGSTMRLPGFRRGKVPAAIVIGRIGRDAVLEEAVRERLGRWFAAAVSETRIVPVGDPEITLGEDAGEGEPFPFSFEIGVRPVAKLGEWRGIEAPRREPRADDELVERQLEDARERLARVETVDRPAGPHDFLVIDFEGSVDGEPIEGASARAQLVELGAGRLLPGFDEGLAGATAGEERTLNIRFPDDYSVPELAGRDAVFAVTVAEVREKVLPELDDDFALDAAGMDTLDELREDVRARLREADERAVEREFREAVLDAAAERADVTVPAALVEARAKEAWESRLHALSHQGVSKEAYLRISGTSEEEILESARPAAERALRAESVIAAIVESEKIEPTDEDLLAVIGETITPDARGKAGDPKRLMAQLRKTGRLESLREDVAERQALDRLVEAAVAITPERAAAREKLWTPGSEERKKPASSRSKPRAKPKS
jgi:trigger factor